ncbi:unnamed protein product [Arctogadus glacialis]
MCVDRPGPSLWPRHPALIRPATPRAEEPGPCMGVSTALHSYTIYVHIYRGPTGGLSPAQPYSPPAGQGPPGATEGESGERGQLCPPWSPPRPGRGCGEAREGCRIDPLLPERNYSGGRFRFHGDGGLSPRGPEEC